MTYEELKTKVERKIHRVQTVLAYSPISAALNLSEGIGYVEGICELNNWDGHILVDMLERAKSPFVAKLNH